MATHSFRLALIAVPLLLSACAGGGSTSKQPAPAGDEIVIGVAGPMTGDLAAFGEQLRRGAEQAVADLNAEGGVLGKKLRLVIGDDQCDPKRAVQVAQQLIADGAVFVDGHFCSGSSIPASDIYGEAKVLQITPASTNSRLTDSRAARVYKTLFRTCGRDDRQGTFAGEWIAKNYLTKKVAVFDDYSPYGKGVADEAERAIQSGGNQPIFREHFTQRQTDFSEIIARLKSARIAMVYISVAITTRSPALCGRRATLVSRVTSPRPTP
jgi:branched-chain amino acid transport system substrate-binding protein